MDPDPNPDPKMDPNPDPKFPEKSDPNPDPKKLFRIHNTGGRGVGESLREGEESSRSDWLYRHRATEKKYKERTYEYNYILGSASFWAGQEDARRSGGCPGSLQEGMSHSLLSWSIVQRMAGCMCWESFPESLSVLSILDSFFTDPDPGIFLKSGSGSRQKNTFFSKAIP